jgi:nucleoside-diphosphate-sugar epimerase
MVARRGAAGNRLETGSADNRGAHDAGGYGRGSARLARHGAGRRNRPSILLPRPLGGVIAAGARQSVVCTLFRWAGGQEHERVGGPNGPNMNILITGGAGYVGCRLVPALVADGHRVVVIDKLVFGDEGLAVCRDQIDLRVQDIRSLAPRDFAGFDAVVHLAGLSNDPTAEFWPEATRNINFDATVKLGRSAKMSGVRRFVFASSCSVYHQPEWGDEVQDEDAKISPRVPYSRSKWHAERALLDMTDEHFKPVILRKGTIFGESPRMRYDLVVNAFTCDAFKNQRLTVHAAGRMWRPLLHIDEAVLAYRKALSASDEAVGGRVFNVLGDNHQILEVALAVRNSLRDLVRSEIVLDLQPIGASRSYRASGDRFREAVGFAPAQTITSAVSDMWAMLASRADPNNAIYYNVQWIRALLDTGGGCGATDNT